MIPTSSAPSDALTAIMVDTGIGDELVIKVSAPAPKGSVEAGGDGVLVSVGETEGVSVADGVLLNPGGDGGTDGVREEDGDADGVRVRVREGDGVPVTDGVNDGVVGIVGDCDGVCEVDGV